MHAVALRPGYAASLPGQGLLRPPALRVGIGPQGRAPTCPLLHAAPPNPRPRCPRPREARRRRRAASWTPTCWALPAAPTMRCWSSQSEAPCRHFGGAPARELLFLPKPSPGSAPSLLVVPCTSPLDAPFHAIFLYTLLFPACQSCSCKPSASCGQQQLAQRSAHHLCCMYMGFASAGPVGGTTVPADWGGCVVDQHSAIAKTSLHRGGFPHLGMCRGVQTVQPKSAAPAGACSA